MDIHELTQIETKNGERVMAYKVPFVNPARNYKMIKDEIDAAYFDVMSKGDLIDRGHLKSFKSPFDMTSK